MIQIYKPGNENFSKNGDAVLQCFHCDVAAELNGTWVLNAEVPLDNEDRWKLVTEEAVLKVPTWQDDEQLYRISQVTKTEDGVSMIAYPIFYDSANDCFLMDCRPTGKTAQEALDIMMKGSPYSGETNITTANTAYFVRRNLLDAICGNNSPTFLERWGGEVLYDNYKIIINDHVGGDYGVEARYGRNIEGVTYVVDGTGIVTRIVPVAYNGYMMSGNEPWVDSEYINSYAKVYTKEIHYENIRMAADAGSGDDDGLIICDTQAELDAALRAAAEADFASGMDAAKVTIDVDMAIVQSMASLYSEELLDSDGGRIQDNTGQDILAVWYRDYANLEKVRLGDTIRCRHSRLDITSTARVISMTWDCCLKKVSHVTLGDYSYNYVKNITNAINRVAGITRDDGTLIAEKVQGFLDGAQTQLRTQYNLAARQDVMAILFENLDENSPMYGALGIGTQGICISKTRTEDGRDWDWTTGITANGMNASMGVFGILTDKLGKNWINLDTGELRLSSETLIGEKTIEGYMSEADQALAEYAEATDATIAGIQAQIDGQYTTYFEDYTPTLSNLPASDWTTEALKAQHEGDLFYNKTDGNSYRFFKNNGVWEWTLITDTTATQALALANAAKDTADGKRRVFTAQPVPPYDVGDIYFDGTKILVCMTAKASGTAYQSTDFVKRDAYTDNTTFGDFVDTYNETISGIQSELDDRIETWSQAADPSTSWTAEEQAGHAGDIWIDTGTGVTRYWTGSAWTEFTSNPPSTVISSINAKATIFTSQPTPPYRVGDLWFDSLSADIMTCMTQRLTGNFNANDWAKRNKYTDNTELTNFIDGDFAEVTDSLQSQVDAKIESWYQNTDPALAWTGHTTEALQDHTGADITDENSEIITAEYESEKILHEGDIWYNTADGTQWRYHLGVWEEIDVPAVLWDTVDSKKTIYSTQPVPPYNVNDLWVQGETGDILVCKTGRSSGSFSADDWILASKYTDDSALTTFINGSYADTIDELREQADGKAETWYQATDPSTTWDDPAIHKGDLWYNTTDQTTWFWNGTAWQQQNVPAAVFDKIDTKAQIFATQPTVPYHINDLWYTGSVVKVCTTTRTTGSFNSADWVKKDYYTDDSALQTFIEGDFAETLAEVQNQIDGKIQTWYQATDPSLAWTGKEETVLQDHTGADILDESGAQITGPIESEKLLHIGDIWQNSTDNTQWRWGLNGGGWEPMSVPDELLDTLDGKSAVFVGSATPQNPEERDLWFKGADQPILTFVSGTWVEYNKYTSDENLYDFVDNTYGPAIEDIQEQLDGKIELFFYEYVPTLTNIPASEWTTTEDKDKHVGDLFYNTAGGNEASYRFEYDSTKKVYQWVRIKDADIDKALSDASKAQDTADNKRRVFTTQPKPPYDVGDMWVQGSTGDIMVCKTARASGNYSANDFQKASKYTDDSMFANWMENTYTGDMRSVNDQLDKKIQTWYQNTNPATSWSTDAAKSEHVGDVWQNTSTGRTYIYTSTTSGETTTYAWNEITTTPPVAVQNTIEKKKQVFVGADTPTPPYAVGDLWITGSAETGAMRYCSTARTSGTGQIADWSLTPTETKAQATISALNGEVIAKVVAGSIINAINISKEGIKIDATNLNINGIVSANNYFKILADGSFETIKGKIGQINIIETAIYSGSHNTVKSESAGFILNKDGEFSVGDKDQYIRYAKGTDGKYKAEIKVESLTISGEAAPTAADIRTITGSIGNVSSVASGAATAANSAQSTANSASSAAAAAQTAAGNAAKTATNYLYWDSTNGLIVSETGTKEGTTEKPHNVQVLGTGINFRSGTKVLGSINGTAFTLYKPNSNNVKSMELLANGLYFYKSDGTTVTSKFTDTGLEIATGTIGGFTIDAKSMYTGALGQENSAFVSSGTTAKAIIAGSEEKAGWLFTASNTFGVNKDGNIYFNKGLAGNIVIDTNSIHTKDKNSLTNKTDGFYLGADGSFAIGNDTSYLKWESTKDEGETAKTWKLKAYVTELLIGGAKIKTEVDTAKSTANTAKSTADTAKSTADTAKSTADTAKSTADTAKSTADTAKSDASTAKTNASTALDKAQYLYQSASTGVIVTTNPSNPTSGYHTQITSEGINLRYGATTKLGITSDSVAMFAGSGDSTYKAMELTSTGLVFNRRLSDSIDEVASITKENGLNVKQGIIGGFIVSNRADTKTHIFKNSLYSQYRPDDGRLIDYEYGITTSGTGGDDPVFYVASKLYNDGGYWGDDHTELEFYVDRNGHLHANYSDIYNLTIEKELYINNLKTSSNAALYITTRGLVCKQSSSSARYKIIDRQFTEADVKKAYDINVCWAKYKPGYLVEDDPWNGKLMPMFIAENVVENIPEAARYENGLVEDWCERVMIPIHHQMIKDQKKHIDALEAEMKQLKEALRRIA